MDGPFDPDGVAIGLADLQHLEAAGLFELGFKLFDPAGQAGDPFLGVFGQVRGRGRVVVFSVAVSAGDGVVTVCVCPALGSVGKLADESDRLALFDLLEADGALCLDGGEFVL